MKKGLALITVCSIAISMLTCGCSHQSNSFPELPEETQVMETSETSLEEETVNTGLRSITAALPYSSDTIDLLAKLYYAKETGIWDETESGDTVSLDYLDSISTNIVINSLGTPYEGADISWLKAQEDDDTMPDIFLSSDPAAAFDAGLTISLNEYVYDSPYLDPAGVYSDALSYCSEGGMLYGLPHYASCMILFGNTDLMPESGRLPAKMTVEELEEYLRLIDEEHEGIVPFASAYQMTPYLGSCFAEDSMVSYMCREEFRADPSISRELILDIVSFVVSLYEADLSSDTDSEGADPVYSRSAAMWIGSSSQIRTWAEYYPDKLYLAKLPSSDVSNTGALYLNCYPICVTKSCSDPDFAASFASFISYDEDAVKLIFRLENMTGFLPLTRNAGIWDYATSGEGIWNVTAQTLKQIMDNAVYCPSSYDSKLYSNVMDYLSAYYYKDEDFSPEACYGT